MVTFQQCILEEPGLHLFWVTSYIHWDFCGYSEFFQRNIGIVPWNIWATPSNSLSAYSSLHKVKVKCTLVQALRLCTGRTAHRGSRGIALPFHDYGTRRGWGVSVMPRPLFTPPGKTRYPLYRRQGGPKGRSGQVRKISPLPGFDPRTVQPVASHYTGYATRPTFVTHCHLIWGCRAFSVKKMLSVHIRTAFWN